MDTYEVSAHPRWHNYPDHFTEALSTPAGCWKWLTGRVSQL